MCRPLVDVRNRRNARRSEVHDLREKVGGQDQGLDCVRLKIVN